MSGDPELKEGTPTDEELFRFLGPLEACTFVFKKSTRILAY